MNNLVDKIFGKLKTIRTFVKQIFRANHNKDYSVVKTFEAGQLAFFYSLNKGNSRYILFLDIRGKNQAGSHNCWL
jgi:hypothetical protein